MTEPLLLLDCGSVLMNGRQWEECNNTGDVLGSVGVIISEGQSWAGC